MGKNSDRHEGIGWASSQAADRLADYVARGRKHQPMSTDQLIHAWIDAFRSMVNDVRNRQKRSLQEELKAELLLRGTEPPYGSVLEEFEKFVSQADQIIAELQKKRSRPDC
jgi:hypothetical protein